MKFLDKLSKFIQDKAAMIEIVYIAIYLGIAVVAGSIIIYITQQVLTITGTPASEALNNSSGNLLETMEIGYSFLPIVAVAAIGAVAIGYVFGLIPDMGGKKGEGGAGV